MTADPEFFGAPKSDSSTEETQVEETPKEFVSPAEGAQEVKGADVDGVEYVNVQVGSKLHRDGGPYGDEVDGIRDERLSAAREGRAPDFSNIIPDQYHLVPKEEAKNSGYDVGSQRRHFVPEETVVNLPSGDYTGGQIPESVELETVQASEEGAQTHSENVTKAVAGVE